MDTPTPDPDDLLAKSQAHLEEMERRHAEWRAQEPERRREHEAAMAELEATRARLEALKAQPSGPAQGGGQAQGSGAGSLKTTVTQVRKWAEEEEHPNWIWAAYADLAQRMTKMEGQLEELRDDLRMILGQLMLLKGQDDER
jgi:hypothetical protein